MEEEQEKDPMKFVYTPELIDELRKLKLHPENNVMYLHCRHCLEDKPDDVSPKEWGQYEVATNVNRLPSGLTLSFATVWCKRCGRLVWDSRHLKHAY